MGPVRSGGRRRVRWHGGVWRQRRGAWRQRRGAGRRGRTGWWCGTRPRWCGVRWRRRGGAGWRRAAGRWRGRAAGVRRAAWLAGRGRGAGLARRGGVVRTGPLRRVLRRSRVPRSRGSRTVRRGARRRPAAVNGRRRLAGRWRDGTLWRLRPRPAGRWRGRVRALLALHRHRDRLLGGTGSRYRRAGRALWRRPLSRPPGVRTAAGSRSARVGQPPDRMCPAVGRRGVTRDRAGRRGVTRRRVRPTWRCRRRGVTGDRAGPDRWCGVTLAGPGPVRRRHRRGTGSLPATRLALRGHRLRGGRESGPTTTGPRRTGRPRTVRVRARRRRGRRRGRHRDAGPVDRRRRRRCRRAQRRWWRWHRRRRAGVALPLVRRRLGGPPSGGTIASRIGAVRLVNHPGHLHPQRSSTPPRVRAAPPPRLAAAAVKLPGERPLPFMVLGAAIARAAGRGPGREVVDRLDQVVGEINERKRPRHPVRSTTTACGSRSPARRRRRTAPRRRAASPRRHGRARGAPPPVPGTA